MYFVRTLVIFLRTIKNRHVMDGFRVFASYTIVLSNMIWLANICKFRLLLWWWTKTFRLLIWRILCFCFCPKQIAHAKIQTLESNLENLLTRETKMKSLIRTLEQEKTAYQKAVEQIRNLLPADILANCEPLLRDLNCNPNNKAKTGNKPWRLATSAGRDHSRMLQSGGVCMLLAQRWTPELTITELVVSPLEPGALALLRACQF